MSRSISKGRSIIEEMATTELLCIVRHSLHRHAYLPHTQMHKIRIDTQFQNDNTTIFEITKITPLALYKVPMPFTYRAWMVTLSA